MITRTGTAYRAEVESALADGWRPLGLHASSGGRTVRVLLADRRGRTRVVSVDVPASGQVDSLVDLAPALGWDEREAHDLYRVRFAGHEPLRPLADHAAPLEAWTVPVRGHDSYQVAVGPIHAGVIESGHFRFHVVGDRILHLDARLFYKHRGLERAAEGLPLPAALAVVSRACAACSAANGVAYATAAEQLMGLRPPPALARVRTVLLELERTWNHLNDIAATCAGVGMAAGSGHFLALTELARRLNAALTGHRFLAGTVAVGGSGLALDRGQLDRARRELDGIGTAAERGWHALAFNTSFQDRLGGVGVIDGPTAHRFGVVGPAARAAGLPHDARTTSAGLSYAGFEPVLPSAPTGDVRARIEQRILELRQSLGLLDRLLNGPAILPLQLIPDLRGQGPASIGIGVVESPRGETSCVVEAERGTLTRVRLRTGSYANWPAVAHAAVGNLLPDFPLINKSFELCYACADR